MVCASSLGALLLRCLAGFFRTAPMNVVEQPGKLRITTDHSFPRKPIPEYVQEALRRRELDPSLPLTINPEDVSINSLIDPKKFGCAWGYFILCLLLVHDAPEGTQVAVSDVKSAFRIIPTPPEERKFTVISLPDGYHLNYTLDFGACPSPGIFGRVADCIVAIFLACGVAAILKWVDDFIFFRYAKTVTLSDGTVVPIRDSAGNYIYDYDSSIIWSVAKRFGWPWAPEKFFDFAFAFLYLGFLWSLIDKTVSLPEKKKAKYRAKIEPYLLPGATCSSTEIQSVVGTLNHVCLVVRDGRSRMRSLYAMSAVFEHSNNHFATKHISPDARKDLEWWYRKLGEDFVGMKCVRPPPIRTDVSIMVDASTVWGIGLVLNGRWLAWELKEGWKSDGRDIGWGEMVAVLLAVRSLQASHLTGHILLQSDNQGVVGALAAGVSRGKQQNDVLQHIVDAMHDTDIFLTIEYVNTKDNIADAPSRGNFPPRSQLLAHPPRIPYFLRNFVHNSVPYHDLSV